MSKQFIPSFHFINPDEKLSDKDFCWQAVNHCYFNSGRRNLLSGKNIDEIEGYSTGDFDMMPFKRMFKSMSKALKDNNSKDGLDSRTGGEINTVGVGFVPLPLIPTKLNSATAVTQKIPIEVKAEAQDPLAAKKKNSDLEFLKNKPALEQDLQGIADQMNIGKVDLGTTKYSSTPFSESPYGLDLNESDELQVFVDLLYALGVEAAFETLLQSWWDIKNGNQIKLLEIKDQLKYGVSANKAYTSSMTGLPEIEYVWPGNIETPPSDLPDYSDRPYQFESESVTPLQLFNYFGNEICNEETLNDIVNGFETGYCACNNNTNKIHQNDFNSFKMQLVRCEIKSIDYVGVAPLNKKSRFSFIPDEKKEQEKCSNKVWGQNTYCFWWLKNTKHFFGIHRLGYANRTRGLESYQNFSTNIYKSQEKSAVELSIGENKKAQIADIKMQHAIIKSLPAGKYIDLRFLRNALSGLTQDADNKYTQQQLIDLAMEQNIMIGDSEGFEGKNDGQFKPFIELPGGVKSEVVGYMQVIADANSKIAQFTGINEQLTGQSANPEGLIGLQKLLINSSINALYYINEAIENQCKKVFTILAWSFKEAIEKGGKPKQAIVNIIGSKKVSLIDSLDEVPLHTIGITVKLGQREEERQAFREEIGLLKQKGVINTTDSYLLDSVVNPRDKFALLAVKEKQWEKRQDKIRQEQIANQQAMVQQAGQNQMATTEAKVDGDIKKIYAQGDVNSKILQLANELGINTAQLDGMIKKSLQQERGQSALNKSIATLQTKQELENQKPYGE